MLWFYIVGDPLLVIQVGYHDEREWKVFPVEP